MPLSSDINPPRLPDGIHYLYFVPENAAASEARYSPHFFVKARIDFNDVRTGFRESVSLSKALEIYSNNAELLWVPDMIQDVDFGKASSRIPEGARLDMLPDFVDENFITQMETQFTQYLLRSFVTRVYRNFALNIYSVSGESRAEFAGRCRELLDAPMRRELDRLQDVYKRRLEQTREKYLSKNESHELEQAKMESHNKNIFSQYSERIMVLFVRDDSGLNPDTETSHSSHGIQDLEERLMSLEQDARQAAAKLRHSYEEKAQALDEYLLHPNPKDIHFVRSGILWMPQKAA